jgi:predicted small lipoprotein YifL
MRWVMIVFLTMMVATCGQKGPLTLPPEHTLTASS